ncbi:hypothetical protein CK203_029563 [Vitis vinifera]|uniref:GAG-pre-integrase domain-containing protein n=1 Tax=Vitis vinifera TaxID=29760 RepID=A0A438JCK2_VITVI|nr:hypothetical protein CK203_029563 [Vitis vinifera]
MNSKSFSLNWNKDESSAYPCPLDQAELWHKRMGHFHYSALDYMQKKDLVLGMTYNRESTVVCGVCQLGKQAKLPFPINKAWRAVEKLQLIHIDKFEVAGVFWKFKTWIKNQSGCRIKNLDKLEQEQVYVEEKEPELQVDDVIDYKLIRGTKSLIEECVMTECIVVG